MDRAMPQMCHTSDHIESMEQGTSEAGLRTGTAAPSGRSYTRASSSGGASTSTSANGSGSSTGHNAGHSLHQEGRPAGDGTGGRAGFGARVQALTGAVQNVLEAARPAEEPYDTAAASAERHRLANSVGLDLPAFVQWVEKSLPFCVLLLMLFVANHAVGIAIFVWLSLTLHRLHVVLRQQVALKGDRVRTVCLSLASITLMHVGLVLFVFPAQRLWKNLILINLLQLHSVWDVLFVVASADVLVRYLGIAAKASIVALHGAGSRAELRRRGQVLALADNAFMFWRNLLGTPVWYGYLCSGRFGSQLWGTSCAGLFMMLKLSVVYERGAIVVVSALALRRSRLLTKPVTAAELTETGHQCAICHDNIQGPIKLHCNHIFCDECISEWLEREGTCPCCRAVVQPPFMTAQSDGLTLLPIIF
mmetsp:Transcript_3340/g.9680  ORF Transcript_3340/g.9680 Transcript_3340/m.9680 type:complete len:420 (-) Transcript_3340:2550-3809(-)